jgi:20S proteasome subunit beta 2
MNYVSLGSGSIAASGILETEYKQDMTLEEGKALCVKAISAGIIEDLGSGSQVDVVVISKHEYKLTRGELVIGKRETEKLSYDLSQKKIPMLATFKHTFEKTVIKPSVASGAMDIETAA